MPKKETLFFATLLILGVLDWVTTITGVVFFGATEQNVLLANLIQSNLFIFSTLKLTAVIFVALCFCKAANLSRHSIKVGGTASFLNISYLMTTTLLLTVVSSNLFALF